MNPKLLFLLCMIYANSQSTNSDLLTGKGNPAWASQGMHPTAMEAFKKMQDAAKTAGIDLELVSGYRSYDRQRSIWNRKYKQFTAEGMTGPDAIQKIITYSTRLLFIFVIIASLALFGISTSRRLGFF